MTDSITITAGEMWGKQLALFIVGQQLRQHPIFTSRLLNEVETYKDGGAVIKHDAADLKAFFKCAGATLVSAAKQKILENCLKTGVFKTFFSKLYTKANLSEVEASARFLLSKNYAAQRVAEGIFPIAPDKSDAELCKSETSVLKIMDVALAAAKELHLPAVASILKARRTSAEQKVAKLSPKTLG